MIRIRQAASAAALLGLAAILASPAARAQGPFFYPSKGQSQDQLQRDQYECHS